jgi:hypothetical protein
MAACFHFRGPSNVSWFWAVYMYVDIYIIWKHEWLRLSSSTHATSGMRKCVYIYICAQQDIKVLHSFINWKGSSVRGYGACVHFDDVSILCKRDTHTYIHTYIHAHIHIYRISACLEKSNVTTSRSVHACIYVCVCVCMQHAYFCAHVMCIHLLILTCIHFHLRSWHKTIVK